MLWEEGRGLGGGRGLDSERTRRGMEAKMVPIESRFLRGSNDVFRVPASGSTTGRLQGFDPARIALYGAVVLIERALRCWETGVKIVPDGTPGHFSADNWGDKTILVEGVAKSQAKVKKLMEKASELGDKDWEYILETGRRHLKYQKASQAKRAIVVESASEVSSTSSDSDFSDW
ncbi:hypothetical protein FKP32DRAFT_1683858 [Trametes sanguinea]|nr:hypothetical protein FKP32DRAFT_1683858 [Trametes sanguinea]